MRICSPSSLASIVYSKDLRSSAGHLTKKSRALGTGSLRRHGLGRRVSSGSSMGGGRSSLLGLGSRSSGGRARRSAADGSLTRHCEVVVRVVVRVVEVRVCW